MLIHLTTTLVSGICTHREADLTAEPPQVKVILMEHYSEVCFNTVLTLTIWLFCFFFLSASSA